MFKNYLFIFIVIYRLAAYRGPVRQQDKGAPPPYDPPVARFARWVRLWSLHPLRSLHPPPRSPPPSLKYAPYSESLPGVRPPPESALPPWGPLFLPGARPSSLESALLSDVESARVGTPTTRMANGNVLV